VGSRTYGHGGDVGEIGGDTGGVDHIVQSELIDERARLQQQREGLSKHKLVEGQFGGVC
jgi:hypothetical protein